LIRDFSWEWFCQKGEILCPTWKKAVLRVSIRTFRRALCLLSDLAFSLEAAGFHAKLTDENERLEAVRAGAAVYLRITEKVEPSYQTRKFSWDSKPRFQKLFMPTGVLSIYIEQAGYGEIRFRDSTSELLEVQWPLILEGVESQHARSSKWRAAQVKQQKASEELQRLRQLDAKRLAEIRALEEAEAKRRAELAQEADRWASAERIRGYVAHLAASTAVGGFRGAEVEQWLAWARAAADQLDPTHARLQSWETKPEADGTD
jgi:hypothetical protein